MRKRGAGEEAKRSRKGGAGTLRRVNQPGNWRKQKLGTMNSTLVGGGEKTEERNTSKRKRTRVLNKPPKKNPP